MDSEERAKIKVVELGEVLKTVNVNKKGHLTTVN